MQILLVGGFLGSGKTTLIRKLIRGIVSGGGTVAIIENEIGEVGIDDAVLGEAEVSITPLFGGCVCCQITGDLVIATNKIENEVNPDWLIIELTGVAFISGIIELFEEYGRQVSSLGVVDVSRFDVIKRAIGQILEDQLKSVDLILLNKADKKPPNSETFDEVRSFSGADNVRAVCARDMTDSELWALVLDGLQMEE